jgi:hypothetical protein
MNPPGSPGKCEVSALHRQLAVADLIGIPFHSSAARGPYVAIGSPIAAPVEWVGCSSAFQSGDRAQLLCIEQARCQLRERIAPAVIDAARERFRAENVKPSARACGGVRAADDRAMQFRPVAEEPWALGPYCSA